jgi:CHAD domain-containing protein
MTQLSVSEIARGVFLTQLHAVQAHLDGCIEGNDPIHLHDLRVANRRSRAALVEFKSLFPQDTLVEYQESFRWIHQFTGDVRDLDVGLQHFPIYQRQIPKPWRTHLEPLRTLLESKREVAQKELVENLRSDRLAKTLSSWSELLDSDLLEGFTLSLEPAKEYGCRRITKRYKRVRTKGRKLTKKSPAEVYHNYRITIKKLRYLMEFFRPVVENEEFSTLRTALKTVQDAFGAFQDAEVQAINLRSLAGELHQLGVSTDTMLALGQLLGTLEKKQRQSKKACIKQVRWITEDPTARAFQSCFQYPVDSK